MTALKIDQLFINNSGIDTCSSGDTDRCIGRYDGAAWGFSRVLVAMVMQETCGEHAQGSVGAHPIGSTREPM